MTKQQVVATAINIVEEMRLEWVPNPNTRYITSTGNMAIHALRYDIKNNIVDITIDESIAPYVPYTNEPWISDKWHGKKNPNEGWWQRFVDEFTKRLAVRLKGELK